MRRTAAALITLALAAGAAHAEPDDPFAALLEAGIPCPVGTGYAPMGLGEGTAPDARPAPSVTRTEEDDLVTIQWDDVSARPLSDDIPIVVEQGTVGLMIRAEAPRDLFEISVELYNPAGELIACEECVDAPVVSEIRGGRGTTQVPSTDRPGWELAAGTYTFRVRATPVPDGPLPTDGTEVRVTATLRTDAAVVVDRFLDLNFVYLPGSGLTSEDAPTSGKLAEVLQAIDEALAPTGIRIGQVSHTNLNVRGFAFIGTWDDAGKMFRTSRTLGRERALNVYCVRGFEPPLLNVVGLSGGIPGPPLNGSPDSGIIIRLAPLFTCGSCIGAFGSLFAHEVGHYLGLYHTTEANQKAEDPFLDTPRCNEHDLRDCPDYDYVMFPLIHSANRVWSPGQIAVVQTHPFVYTAPVVGGARTVQAPDDPGRAWPNPFRDRVSIELGGATGVARQVQVYDVSGRRIRDLGPAAGSFSWDGRTDAGAPAPDGVYFARVASDDGVRTLRIVKLR